MTSIVEVAPSYGLIVANKTYEQACEILEELRKDYPRAMFILRDEDREYISPFKISPKWLNRRREEIELWEIWKKE